MHPVEIVVEDDALRIDWQDGTRSVIPLLMLRRACSCSACRTGEGMRSMIYMPVLTEAAWHVKELLLVSSSLLRVVWEDGHDRSLYRFADLRTLVPPSTPPLR